METFNEAREFVKNAHYDDARHESLAVLKAASIDKPIVDIIAGFATLPHCFTLQCCSGHFIHTSEQNPHTIEPIPPGHSGMVRYRIAYIAFCIENSARGKTFRHSLSQVPAVAPGYVQFGSADWFWKSQVNSYALQVMPDAHQCKDETILDTSEALKTKESRGLFFREMRTLLASELNQYAGC